MTAQIPDTVGYQDDSYSIAGIQGEGLFVPQEYGLEPAMLSTACYRGFICHYGVRENRLSLQSLRIRLKPEEGQTLSSRSGPPLFGIEPGYDKDFGCLLYEQLEHPVNFSGGLLIASDFIRELYVHMGFHPAYKFRTVHEILFEGGLLVKSRDLSEEMARYREQTAGRPLEPDIEDQKKIENWINDCFSLDYVRKPPSND